MTPDPSTVRRRVLALLPAIEALLMQNSGKNPMVKMLLPQLMAKVAGELRSLPEATLTQYSSFLMQTMQAVNDSDLPDDQFIEQVAGDLAALEQSNKPVPAKAAQNRH